MYMYTYIYSTCTYIYRERESYVPLCSVIVIIHELGIQFFTSLSGTWWVLPAGGVT